MKWLFLTLLYLSCLNASAQKRAAIFNVDMKHNPYGVTHTSFSVHVREVTDRSRYLDSNGHFDEQKFATVLADKVDTLITLNADFSFKLRNLKPGTLYSISMYYRIPLDTFNSKYVYRTRARYQEVKINNWTYEYTIKHNEPCNYDVSLQNRTCPKCRRKDYVLPILYGTDDRNLSLPDPYPLKGYDAGTDVTGCDPNWFCKRDKISF
jgi:hypothetical protein